MKTLFIIINFHSAYLTIPAVASILESERMGSIQIVVVDNSCDAAESRRLKKSLPREIVLRVNSENVGFGRACNTAFQLHDSDLIFLLNPDARLLPGCVLQLQRSLLQLERAGAVGPQIYWDENKRFYLPPSHLPEWLWFHPLISKYPFLHRAIGWIWRRFAIRVWQAGTPIRVYNLSGGHVLLKRDAVTAVGGLFDDRFFLYYEDTDLFMRMRYAGYRLYVEPRAEVIHLYDQCGRWNAADKQRLMLQSYQMFIEKHSRGWKRAVWKRTKKCNNRPSTFVPPSAQFFHPFQIPVPEPFQKQWLFEWSPNTDFIPAAGHFGTGPTMQFPMECWQLLAPGQYFGRLGRPSGLKGCYVNISWIKGSDDAK